jgi:hypothetical protein
MVEKEFVNAANENLSRSKYILGFPVVNNWFNFTTRETDAVY